MKPATWNLMLGFALSAAAFAQTAATQPATTQPAAAQPASQPAMFRQDLEQATGAKLPDDLQVMAGDFVIAGEAGKHYLELPGEPLDTFGLLFGPAIEAMPDVSARIWSAPTGKRFPEFGIGCCDVSGYKLWVIPGQGMIELRKGDEARASCSFTWKPEEWIHLRLRVIHGRAAAWRVEGKTWEEGTPEPQKWTLSFDETEQPSAGRASLWGEPFSGKPIRFDNLTVGRAG